MKLSMGDGIVAATAAVATLMPHTLPAWAVAAAGQYCSDFLDPLEHPLVTVAYDGPDLGPVPAVRVYEALKVGEAFGHSGGWMLLRPLLRRAPAPVAAALGALTYVAMRQGAGLAGQAIDARQTPPESTRVGG